MNENRLKISNPHRVARILRRICQASLPVMVRSASGGAATAVKGRAASIASDGQAPCIRVSNISDKGIAHLISHSRIQVEFVMMATKVVFASSIIAREQNSILISMPSALVSIERRKNARYGCTQELTAFLDLSLWRPEAEDPTAPIVYPHCRSLGSYLSVADISFGGLCAVSRFPAVSLVLRRGVIDDRARLILPMQQPLEVGVEIRWFKRIKEHVKTDTDEHSFMRFYRFGVEFTTQSDQVRMSIRQFIQQLSQADAI